MRGGNNTNEWTGSIFHWRELWENNERMKGKCKEFSHVVFSSQQCRSDSTIQMKFGERKDSSVQLQFHFDKLCYFSSANEQLKNHQQINETTQKQL